MFSRAFLDFRIFIEIPLLKFDQSQSETDVFCFECLDASVVSQNVHIVQGNHTG